MGIATEAIVVIANPEFLGPESLYEIQRSKLRNEYSPILAAAAKINVTDHDSAEEAVKYGRLLQNGTKETEEFFKRIKAQIDAIKKPVLQAERDDQELLDVEKSRLSRELTVYRERVEQERREAQRKAEEEAAAKAKIEQEELERQAREEQLARAVELDMAGDHEAAEALVAEAEALTVEPLMPAPVVVQAAAPARFAGSTGRVNWTAEVIGWGEKMQDQPDAHPGWVNFRKLVEAVAAGKAPLRSLQPDKSFIATKGRNEKQGFSLPGCELKRTTSTSFRA
jgi:hypothetical protein